MAEHINELGQYTRITAEVFQEVIGPEWDKARIAKRRTKLQLSGERFNLETLEGPPDGGLLHPRFHRTYVEVLNVSRNQLVDISCLNRFTDGRPDFLNLYILNASHNSLLKASISAPRLLEVNLSHNELREIPDVARLGGLQKLILSHNRIDDTLDRLVAKNVKIRHLDLSSNCISWRPSLFQRQIRACNKCPLEVLSLHRNPFGVHFDEYQVLALSELAGLTHLDGQRVAPETRTELKLQMTRWLGKVDFSALDIRVQDRARSCEPPEESRQRNFPLPEEVPSLTDLTAALDRALDRPSEAGMHIYAFEEQVRAVWAARPCDREQLLRYVSEEVAPPSLQRRSSLASCHASGEGGRRRQRHGASTRGIAVERQMTADEEAAEVVEFASRMQQALNRFDTSQDALIGALARLLISGSAALSTRCAQLLGEWLDAAPAKLQARLSEVAVALFGDLVRRIVAGIRSAAESPVECLEASHSDRRPADAGSVAEASGVLCALGFGLGIGVDGPAAAGGSALSAATAIWARETLPARAAALRPFVPLLCAESCKRRGPPQPCDRWAEFRNSDSFPGDVAETMEIQAAELERARLRCARRGWGGFVASEVQPGMLRVTFKAQDPQVLAGARRSSSSGSVLHVRPSRSPFDMSGAAAGGGDDQDSYEAWGAFVGGLAVLCAATSDAQIAADCVSSFELHRTIASSLCGSPQAEAAWTEQWLARAEPEGPRAFAMVLQVAENLTRARGDAGVEAASVFCKSGVLVDCWSRARSRVGLDAGPDEDLLSPDRLSDQSADEVTVLAALVGLVCGILQRLDEDAAQVAVNGLRCQGLDLFDALISVVVHSASPDPLLLAASLNLAEAFLGIPESRQLVGERFLQELQDGALLIPFVRGPKVDDRHNGRYQELWRQCEMKYGSGLSARERYPELWEADSASKEDRNRWRRRVPELRDLRHPLMHRALLAVVRLFGLISDKARCDPMMHRASASLDMVGREVLLICPASSLSSCPAASVRVQCLRCVASAVRTSPEQCDVEELGWIVRFLSPTGLGAGGQGEVVSEALDLVTLLVKSQALAGRTFRGEFAQEAVRESFGLLRACTGLEGERRRGLVRRIVRLLDACSRPLAGGIRRFLRRADLLTTLREVLAAEAERADDDEEDDDEGDEQLEQGEQLCMEEALLRTWSGRSVRDILLPLACSGRGLSSSLGGARSRLCALARLADVLQGKLDYGPGDIFSTSPTTSEAKEWLSAARAMRSGAAGPVAAGVPAAVGHCGDASEIEDWQEQREAFVSGDGLRAVAAFLRAFSCEAAGARRPLEVAERAVQQAAGDAVALSGAWLGEAGAIGSSAAKAVALDAGLAKQPAATSALARAHTDAGPSELERCFLVRLRAVNARVSAIFNCNANVFDERSNTSSLAGLAHIMAIHFQENHRKQRAQLRAHPAAFRELLTLPSLYLSGRELTSAEDLQRFHLEAAPCRQQPRLHLDALLDHAHVAQRRLKRLLVAGKAHSAAEAHAWASAMFSSDDSALRGASTPSHRALDGGTPAHGGGGGAQRRVSVGLVGWLREHGAEVLDPGVLPRAEAEYLLRHRLGGDVARLRGLSRLLIFYPNVEALLASLKELIASGRLAIQRVRNLFASPTNFAERAVVLNVELDLDSGPHLAELRLTTDGASGGAGAAGGAGGCGAPVLAAPARRAALVAKLGRRLVETCRVAPAEAPKVAELLTSDVESRVLRHGDIVTLRCASDDTKHLEASEACDLVAGAEEDASFAGHLFRVDREQGFGAVRFGDVVMLRSRAHNRYIELGVNHRAHCRGGGGGGAGEAPHGEIRGARFVVAAEGLDPGELPPRRPKGLRSGARVSFCIRETERYLTVAGDDGAGGGGRSRGSRAGGAGGGAADDRRWRVRGLPREQGSGAELQTFVVHREGSLAEHLCFEGDHSGGAGPRHDRTGGAGLGPELCAASAKGAGGVGVAMRILLEANMQLPAADGAAPAAGEGSPAGEGAERGAWAPATFRSIVAQQVSGAARRAGARSAARPRRRKRPGAGGPGPPLSGPVVPSEEACRLRLPSLVAAGLRCAYALVAFGPPAQVDGVGLGQQGAAWAYTRGALWLVGAGAAAAAAPASSLLPQLLALAICAQRSVGAKAAGDDGGQDAPAPHAVAAVAEAAQAATALLPAKVLRLLSALVALSPQRPAGGSGGAGRGGAANAEEAVGSNKLLDSQRLSLLGLASSYLTGAVAPALSLRLAALAGPGGAAGSHCSLEPGESATLRELAGFVEIAAIAVFSAEGPFNKSGGLARDPAAAGECRLGRGELGEGATRVDLIRRVVPRPVVGVLVRAMLYAMHLEALAYSAAAAKASAEAPPVRLMSALVDRAIVALTAAARGYGEGPEGIEYEICEAIAQAMASGALFVSRARAAELMRGRALERLRGPLQELLASGAAAAREPEAASGEAGGRALAPAGGSGGSSNPWPKRLLPAPGERVAALALVWVAGLDGHGGLVAQMSWAPTLSAHRAAVAVTSRSRLLVLELGASMGEVGGDEEHDRMLSCVAAAEWSELPVHALRPLGRLRRMVVRRRMPQFLGLLWEDDDLGLRREVFVFETAARRRAFLQALRVVEQLPSTPASRAALTKRVMQEAAVERPRSPAAVAASAAAATAALDLGGGGGGGGGPGGIPATALAREVWDSMRATTRKERGRETGIINVTFVRSQQSSPSRAAVTSSDATANGPAPGRRRGASAWAVAAAASTEAAAPWQSEAASGETREFAAAGGLEVLVLTPDTVATIGLGSFLERLSRADVAEHFADAAAAASSGAAPQGMATLEDSDDSCDGNDGDDDRPDAGQAGTDEGPTKMQALRGGPWPLSGLQGVWFLADSEPMVRLQFAGGFAEELLFTSEGERQRWRRLLAAALDSSQARASAGRRGAGPGSGGAGGGGGSGSKARRSAWAVMPTDKTTLEEARQAHHEQRIVRR